MTPLFVVVGSWDYEGSRVVGAFVSPDAATFYARRYDMASQGFDRLEVVEFVGPVQGASALYGRDD